MILLDLRNDRYLGLGPDEAKSLAGYVRHWPCVRKPDGDAKEIRAFDAELLGELVARNLVVPADPDHDSRPTMPRVPKAASVVQRSPDSAVRTLDVLRFVAATAVASYVLKRWPLERVVAHAAATKQRQGCTSELPSEELRRLIDVADSARPFVFTSRDHCLFDSLALMLFLARYNFAPLWIFGVQTPPFAAHSWVQSGDTVLNDTPERVLAFTPILVV